MDGGNIIASIIVKIKDHPIGAVPIFDLNKKGDFTIGSKSYIRDTYIIGSNGNDIPAEKTPIPQKQYSSYGSSHD
ncbi:hypothetical protein D3C74_474510 [compost metagenome]